MRRAQRSEKEAKNSMLGRAENAQYLKPRSVEEGEQI